MSPEQPSSLIERFEDLFKKIDEFAEPIETGRPRASGINTNRMTPKAGELAMRFVLFDSKARYQRTEDGKQVAGDLLYSPSITVFPGQPGEHIHIKKNEIISSMASPGDDERLEELDAEIKKAENLFASYAKKRAA